MSHRLIITDIDGCLTQGRGLPIDLNVFAELRRVGSLTGVPEGTPWLAVVTARPQPYLEAILQAIGGNVVGLFEWGCGMFQPDVYRRSFHPSLGPDLRERITVCKAHLTVLLEKANIGFLQPGKEVAITAYPFRANTVETLYEVIADWLSPQKELSDLLVLSKSKTYVNILPRSIHKGIGVEWMLNELAVPCELAAGIGDAEDDLPFLRICGDSGAPNNAVEAVRYTVNYCSPHTFGAGVLDCIHHFGQGHM